MKSKKVLFVLLGLFLLTLLPIFKGNNLYSSIKHTIESKKYRSSLTEQRQENYNKLMIEYVDVKSRVTGTEPFNQGDVSDSTGIDVSPNDEYIRTFDIVKYTLDLGIGSNKSEDGVTDSSVFQGGVIKVRAKLPNQGDLVLMTWEKDAWMQNVSYNDDKTEIYAEYHVPENVSITNANQNLTFTVKVGGYKREITDDMAPIFEVWMEGNGPDDDTSTIDSVIVKDKSSNLIISSKPSYDVILKPSTYLYNGVRDNVSGYYAAYGIGISMVQPESNLSDLRGVEYPTGKFDIELENTYLARDILKSSSDYIVVDENTPNSLGVLNNTSVVAFSVNGVTNDGYYPNKKVFTRDLPYGMYGIGSDFRSVASSGDMSLALNGNITTVSFENYKFSGQYPTNNTHSVESVINFPSNTGYFATGNIQLFIPYYSETDNIDYNYSYKVKVKSIKYNDSNGKSYSINSSEDGNKDNNELGIGFSQHNLKGSFYVQTTLNNNSVTQYDGLSSSTLGGFVYPTFILMPIDGPYEGGAERLIKWNAKYFTLSKQNDKWETVGCYSELGFDCPSKDSIDISYGILKTDSNNGITTDEDVNSLKKDAFEWYDTAEEAMENGKITAVLGYDHDVVGNRVHRNIKLKLEVTSDETLIGTVGSIVHRAIIYGDEEKTLVYTPYSDVNYIETEYSEEGNVTKNHSPSAVGTSVLVLGAKTNIVTSVSDLDSAGDLKKAYDVRDNEINVNLTLSISNDKPAQDNDKYLESVIVKSTLPNGLSYKDGSANKEPKDIVLNEDGTTVITWEYKDWQVNHQAPEFSEITYKAEISAALDNNTSLVISSEMISEEDRRDTRFRTSDYGVIISNLSGSRAYKEVDRTTIDINESFNITDYIGNTSQDALKDVKALVILPTKEDNNGSNFNGSYSLKINKLNELQKMYYTTNDIDNIGITLDSNGKKTIKDLDISNDSRWLEIKKGEIVPEGATALALYTEEIEPSEEISFSYDVITKDNKAKDTYAFVMNVTSSNLNSAIKTNTVVVKVVSRSISGIAFLDNNDNNVYDSNDTLLKDTVVKLLDSDKKLLKSTKTDNNGNYIFNDLNKGSYYIEFEVDNKYQIIPKGELEVSAKVDSNGITDLLEQNDTLKESAIIDNINLGLKIRTGKVIVHHYIDGTSDSISNDVINTYNYDESYSTSVVSDIPNNYELKNKTDNYQGTIDSDEIEVIYTYKKKDSKIKASISKSGLDEISTKDSLIDYTIKYDVVLSNYIGNGTINIIDYLPYEIDLDSSVLDGGIYDNETKTITWNISWDDIDTYTGNDTKNIVKNIKVKYKKIEIRDIVNKIDAKILLDNNKDIKETEFITKVKIPGKIITHYYLEGTTNKLADSLLSNGFVGEMYDSIPKEIDGYELTKQPREIYVYEENEKVIIYEYRKVINPNTIDNIYNYVIIFVGSILILLIVLLFKRKIIDKA